jgi:adenosyl cobinamide kinase/adenosyl cobinamide phosphate guanylyltransferase
LIFVTGAARSGKSRYAESLAAELAQDGIVLYAATAVAGDEEMQRRVEEHKSRRPRGWRTVEARREIAGSLQKSEAPAVVLLDCLSLLVSNILLDVVEEFGDDENDELKASELVEAELVALFDWYSASGADLIVVSNEAGWGVVPPYRLGRIYRDLLGSANQRIAAEATDAFLTVAGITVTLKGPASA